VENNQKNMRIISGFLKRKKINYLKNLNTRPLKDSVKENIFNILTHSKKINIKIEGSKVLDLYSGVGSFGIECISRGAKIVTFIENDNLAIKVLKENLTLMSILDKSKIINANINIGLEKYYNDKFNIFFLDPPFLDYKFIENLKIIKKKKFFEPNHIIIIHRERGTEDNFNNLIEIIDTKEYRRSKIIFGFFDK